jgi:foldase protein PrsA
VQQKLVLDVAKDENVLPTDMEIDAELKDREQKTPEYIKKIQAQGYSLETIRDNLKIELAQEKIITKGITVTEPEAREFIKQNPKNFMTPAQVRLLWITVKDPKKKALVDAALSTGKSFGEVAMQYSDAPNAKQTQGLFPVSNVAQMQTALQNIVNATPELKTTDWKKDATSWDKFYIQSKLAAKPKVVDAALVADVQRNLRDRKGAQTQNKEYAAAIVAKLKSAKVDVTIPYLQDAWNDAVKNINDASRPGGSPPR